MSSQRLALLMALLASAAMGLLVATLSWVESRQSFLPLLLLCFTYAAASAVPATLLLPGYARRLHHLPVLLQWVAILALALTITAAGCLFTVALFTWTGQLPEGQLWLGWLRSLRWAFVISVTLAVSATLYETVRERLLLAQRALQEREVEKERALALAAEARLASLSARLRPHFLFNTLNSIAQLVRANPAAAERTIERLAALLRSSLDGEQTQLVPLEQEVQLVRDYLEIERVRFGDRLEFRLELADGLEHAMVPPLSLQTLAENSIKHAVARQEQRTHLTLTVGQPQAGTLTFEVSDDGPGLTGPSFVPGHGLDNLRLRLAGLFGSDARLELRRRGRMTVATVVLPARLQRGAA